VYNVYIYIFVVGLVTVWALYTLRLARTLSNHTQMCLKGWTAIISDNIIMDPISIETAGGKYVMIIKLLTILLQ